MSPCLQDHGELPHPLGVTPPGTARPPWLLGVGIPLVPLQPRTSVPFHLANEAHAWLWGTANEWPN